MKYTRRAYTVAVSLFGFSRSRREALRTTLWLVPAAMVLFAVALFAVTYRVDWSAARGRITFPDWVNAGGADVARQTLIAIAAAVITVAGVVFSITILALQLASQQFGPRMLRLFIRDIGTQLSIGAFVATVVYSVLALGSVPVFDPNKLGAQFPKLLVDPAKPLIDRSIDGLYPPGSTFKIVTAADALDAGIITMESKFNDRGGYTIGNFTVKNDEEERTGTQDLTGAFALSSNVDFAMIGVQLGVDQWVDYAHRWGLGDSLSFDLPAAKDHIPKKETISPSILAQLAFGQADLLVTPMRMAVTCAAIANGGTVPRPYLVRRIAGQETSLAVRAEQLAQPISAETAGHVRDMMIAVVKRGTGTKAALPNVTVAGKTGTATNPAGRSHAWFVAFAPAEAPVVAVAIVVENVGYGGTYAAPIARNVLRVALARQRTSVVGNAP